MSGELPLPLGAFRFTFIPPTDWSDDGMAAAFRLRGLLGKGMRLSHCIFDAASTPCEDCQVRKQCFYGNGFEASGNCTIEGFGRVGSLPHFWSLHVGRLGLGWRGTLWLLGHEVERAEQWSQALEQTGLNLQWLPHAEEPGETLSWQAVTPVRLRVNGRNPVAQNLGEAISAACARKVRMLAALHGLEAPEGRLPVPSCESGPWVDVERYAFRRGRTETYGGWMPRINWPDDLSHEWRTWLALLRRLGIGRQTSFGFGRFVCLD